MVILVDVRYACKVRTLAVGHRNIMTEKMFDIFNSWTRILCMSIYTSSWTLCPDLLTPLAICEKIKHANRNAIPSKSRRVPCDAR